ncbi:MAG: pyridoxamine 5'-phosphate oxidase family protein [Candidatus Omnitrophota bacterium]
MAEISPGVKHFLEKQHFVIVASFDTDGNIHTSCKGVVEVDAKGEIIILDLFNARTYKNIKRNPKVTITAVDEHKFIGYSIEGQARIVKENFVPKGKLQIWHEKLARRIAKRVIRHVKGDVTGHKGIPEATFPLPKHVIKVSVSKVVDLAPNGHA